MGVVVGVVADGGRCGIRRMEDGDRRGWEMHLTPTVRCRFQSPDSGTDVHHPCPQLQTHCSHCRAFIPLPDLCGQSNPTVQAICRRLKVTVRRHYHNHHPHLKHHTHRRKDTIHPHTISRQRFFSCHFRSIATAMPTITAT
ncbi:complement C1r-A subcomponent [Striga asiatica]|uniref:Complement C1r-A subcomponent n=1 Tax=Striga asiatica TaxID=4170 RepID=A0A5A7PW45_STRAF|nr:complement C1r-A subcomponent [Striga asiatica]